MFESLSDRLGGVFDRLRGPVVRAGHDPIGRVLQQARLNYAARSAAERDLQA